MIETTRRHLYLAGFMGTGKSVIGREVARRLGWGFIDLDDFIVALCHRTIPQIFELEGEAVFRNLEARALRLAVVSPHSVISLGGGTPLRQGNANIIRATGRTWYLMARTDVIWDRVRFESSRRPLLRALLRSPVAAGATVEDFRAVADPLLQSRNTAYSQIADFELDTSDGTVGSLAARIVEQFEMTSRRGLQG